MSPQGVRSCRGICGWPEEDRAPYLDRSLDDCLERVVDSLHRGDVSQGEVK